MQALGERISERLAGARLVRAEPLSFSGLKTVAPSPHLLAGKRLEPLRRRGKFLVFPLESMHLLVHLSQAGRIDFEQGGKTTRPRNAILRLRFDREPGLLLKEFGTERKAGWWVLDEGDEGPLAKLGPEPFSEEFRSYILDGSDGGRLHALLRDQRRVAGIGRGYADDILHRGRLSPFRSLSSLSPSERTGLLDAVHGILREALDVERRRCGGLPPKLGDHFVVHNRAGAPCPVCGEDLRRISYESHEVTYCPSCQTGGKVLADRRLSRLIR